MKIGSYVECIADFSWLPEYKFLISHGHIFPKKGKIYTIRDFDGSTHIKLVEIINPKKPFEDGYGEISFNKRDFRELVLPSIEELITEENEIAV